MALVIRGIDNEAKACLVDAFSFEGFLGGVFWGISDKAEDFLKEKGISYDVEYEHGVRVLNVKEWIADDILDELDVIAEEREKDPLESKSHHAILWGWGNKIEDYLRNYGEELD